MHISSVISMYEINITVEVDIMPTKVDKKFNVSLAGDWMYSHISV